MATPANQIRLALVGPSGAGKSTTAQMMQEGLMRRGLSSSVHKLAKPLYDLKHLYYQAAGREVAYDAQDHPLMEQIARNLRELSPTSLVDNLSARLDECEDDFIINDDLRDDQVDWPALARNRFRIVRVYAPRECLQERLTVRGDLRMIEDSPLDAQQRRIRSEYVLTNLAGREQLGLQVDTLLERLTTLFRPQQPRLI